MVEDYNIFLSQGEGSGEGSRERASAGRSHGRILEFGSVLEHMCQLLVPKVVDLEVILGVFQGGLLEVSWKSLWGCVGGRFGVSWSSARASFGSFLVVGKEKHEGSTTYMSE